MATSKVSEADLPKVKQYLREHADTSMFLLSNLSLHGPTLSDELNSGNFKYLSERNKLQGVFCLTRRGNLLAESGGNTRVAQAIIDACKQEHVRIGGVVGEWKLADAIWQILVDSGAIASVVHASREPLYRLDLHGTSLVPRDSRVRFLEPSDFDVWEPLNSAYLQEEGLPVQGSLAQRRRDFTDSASSRRWWGAWNGADLIAIAALNAIHEKYGQIGGVYTIPEERRRGLASQVITSLIFDCINVHTLETLILFTGENNTAAQGLYESLRFRRISDFALLFGSPSEFNTS